MDQIGTIEVEDALRDLVAEKGGQFVYQPPDGRNCVYWDRQDQKPSCGIGWVLYHRFGWTADEVAALDGTFDGDFQVVASVLAVRLSGPVGGGRFTEGAARVLGRFQGSQDMGRPYREALEFAVGKARLL